MIRCHMKECHAHQSDRRCNGQRSNKAKKNANEASETDHDLKQRRHYYGALDLEQKYEKINYTSNCKPNYSRILIGS